MKGLITKDILLLKNMKKSFIILIVLAVMYTFMDMGSFAISFCGFMAMFLFAGTIGYDQLDNGYTFLFTMPFSIREYVIEKYLLSVAGFIIGVVIGFIAQIIGFYANLNTTPIDELVITAIAISVVFGILAAIYLPILLKYGAEKSRIVIFIFFAIVAIAAVAMSKVLPIAIVEGVENFLDNLTPASIMTVGLPAAIIALVISIVISIKIMENKEY